MSDNEAAAPKTVEMDKNQVDFTPKEEIALKVAWQCLKAPLDLDMDRFKELGGFKTLKTAQNTWGVIKKKLKDNVEAPETDANGDPVTPMKKTPAKKPTVKKTPTTPKRSKKEVAGDSDDEGQTRTLARKKAKKTPTKVKPEQADEDAADGDELA